MKSKISILFFIISSVLTSLSGQSIINVSNYGVKVDGTQDYTNIIQSILDKSEGKTIFFPRGKYLISSPLMVKSGEKIQGEGDVGALSGSVFIPKPGIKLNCIFSSRTNKLEDIIFENIRTLGSESSVYVNTNNGGYVTKIKWNNCVFQEHNIAINISGTGGMYACTFFQSYVKTCKIAVYCEGSFNINVINNCGFENMQGPYIDLSNNTFPCLGNSFVENRCESVNSNSKKSFAIILNSKTYGFYFERNYIENSFPVFFKTNKARNVYINNNVFTNSTASDNTFQINITGGNASLINNTFLSGAILSVDNNGFCDQILGNTFLNYNSQLKKESLGVVNNNYNNKFN